jgi:hypothetical protein
LNDPSIEVAQNIARNHIDMCRFSGSDDAEYRKVVGALKHGLNGRAALTPEQRRSYLGSLVFDQITARYATIDSAHAQTCKWLLDHPAYQDWLDINEIPNHHGLLWIKGKPGTGKSTIMKFAYDSAREAMSSGTIVAFFFNASGNRLERSALGMYQSLYSNFLTRLLGFVICSTYQSRLRQTMDNGISKMFRIFSAAQLKTLGVVD